MGTMGKGDVRRICEHVPPEIRPMAEELAENVAFMDAKLKATRKSLAKEAVVIPYDNGGGQTGIRKNPAFEMYGNLLASYRKSVQQLVGLAGDAAAAEGESGENPLAQILAEAEAVISNA